MAQGQDGLLVSLEARVNQFEKQMQRAANSNSRAMGQIERRSQQAMRNLQTTLVAGSNQVASALGAIGVQAQGLGGILGAGGIWAGAAAAAVGYVAALRSVSAAVAEIGARADRVGVATEELQRLRFASEQAAGSARAVDEGLDRFTANIAEAARGGGELFNILKANNVALTDGEGRLRSTSDLFRVYADLVKNAANENDQLALAIAAFGRSAGTELVGLLRQGAAGVDELAQAADDAGAVLEDRLVRRAQEIDDRFSALSRTISTQFKGAILEAADAAARLFGVLAASKEGLTAALDAYAQSVRDTSDGESELSKALAERNALMEQLAVASQNGSAVVIADIERRIRALNPEIEKLQELQREYARALALSRSLRAESVTGGEGGEGGAPPAPPPVTVLPDRGSEGGSRARGGRGGGAAARANEFEREIEAIRRRTEALALDAQASSLSAIEADKLRASTELLNAARAAGITITPELKAQVDQLSTAYAEQAEVVRQLEEAQRQMQQVAGMVAEGLADVFTGVITGAKNAEQAIGQLLQQLGRLLINRAFQQLFSGLGSGGGILGALFGRATGGPVQAGRAVRVGEFGPETFVPTQPGRIVPADKGGRGGGGPIQVTYQIDARGAQMGVAEQIDAKLRQYDRQLPGRLSKLQQRAGG